MTLMEKYLRRIEERNMKETPNHASGSAIKSSATEAKGVPLRQVFEERFHSLADKISQYALTGDEIKTQRPELYKQIQEAITEMDTAWLKEDLDSFLEAVKTIEGLYFKALREIPEW
jgi:hypothetical protein